jgi:hypothetical protein
VTGDGITHELAQVLYRAHADEPHAASRALQDAAALTATVERIARDHAADELNAAADDIHVRRFNADDNHDRWPPGTEQVKPDSFYNGSVKARILVRSRAAAAVRARTDQETTHG